MAAMSNVAIYALVMVVYMAALSERGQGNLLGFLNKLAAIAGPDAAMHESVDVAPARVGSQD